MVKKSASALTGLTLLAFALRVYHLGSPPLLWDEGWSIGLSRLSLSEIARITALDVHPPLYYVLLKGWLAFGPHQFVTRFLSVVAGVLTVPLGYHVGRIWRNRRVGLLTALYIAVAPPLVYYSQITRMFAPCVMLLVLGTWGLLKVLSRGFKNTELPTDLREPRFRKSIRLVTQSIALTGVITKLGNDRGGDLRGLLVRWGAYLAFVVGTVGALYSFYYAGFVVAALFVYVMIAAPRRWRMTLTLFGVVVLLYLPWVFYAAPAMVDRVRDHTGFSFAVGRAAEVAVGAFYGLVFPYGIGWPAVYAALLVVIVGALLGARRLGRWALLPAFTISATLIGAAVGAQAHMFAARYTIVASPFLALALAGALGLLSGKGKREKGEKGDSSFLPCSLVSLFPFQFWPFTAGLILILGTTVPTIANYVYSKSYEVFDPFDPSADWRVLHGLADADDIAFFNVLSLAGTYERYRTSDDPAWSYALRWDPVIEPLEAATARIEQVASSYDRLWFVLYKGTVAANATLKSWLDAQFYPAAAPGWREDTLYLAYVDPQGPWRDIALDTQFGNIILDAARYTPTYSPARGVVGLELTWHADTPVGHDAKVFAHLYDSAGNLIAQHDSVPVSGTHPLTTWQVGEVVTDRHGLALPDGTAGPLQLVVGLYNPTTGRRLRTSDGAEAVTIGTVDRTTAWTSP